MIVLRHTYMFQLTGESWRILILKRPVVELQDCRPSAQLTWGQYFAGGGVGDQYMLKQRFSYNRAGVKE